MQEAEVCGKVQYINQKNRKIFHIYAENANKKFTCNFDGFLPLRVGDSLLGICNYTPGKKEDLLVFTRPPFVIMGTDKETILEIFASSLRGTGYNSKKGEEIYRILENIVQKEERKDGLVSLMNEIAMHYNYKETDRNYFTLFSMTCSEIQFKKLAEYWYKNRILRNLYLLGLNNKEINGSNLDPLTLYEKCLDNPYIISSLSLEKCDDIFMRIGKPVDLKYRECGKIMRKISDMMDNNGWTGVPTSSIMKMFPNIVNYMPILKEEFDVQTEHHTIYLSHAYEVETNTSEFVKEILKMPNIYVINEKDISYSRNDLTEDQKNAIELALTNNLSVITGAAGSGKTILINELVHNLEKNGISYRLASFTGKAVARIREVTDKKEPSTLHMMIAMSKGKKNKKELFSHLIIDEASMVTEELLYQFRKCFSHNYKITFVGDPNQLPSIGWGALFDSLIESKIVPTAFLKTVHRTDSNSQNGILINANRIIRFKDADEEEEFDFEVTSNFKVIPGDIEMVKNLLNVLNNSGILSSQIAIISPYNRDLEILNANSSLLYNSANKSISDSRGKIWRIGDRVMATQNNYKYNIMNGSEGIVVDIDAGKGEIIVKMSDSLLKYNISPITEGEEGEKELNTFFLVLSFASSVHKMQGSEKDYIIGYIPQGKLSSTFLNANLLYTLITRSKKIIWLIGDVETMIRSATTRCPWRCSNLKKRLISQ